MSRLKLWGVLASAFWIATAGLSMVLGTTSATYAPPAIHSNAAVAGPDDWPTYLHDGARSGSNLKDSGLSVSTAPNLTQLWKFTTKGLIAAQPMVVGRSLYIGSWDGNEYALNVSTGAKQWATNVGTSLDKPCYSFPRGVTSSATWSNGVLYVGGGGTLWYALNATTGKVLWNLYTGNTSSFYNWGSPLIVGGDAYIGRASGCDNPLIRGDLWKVDLTTHKVVAKFEVVPAGQLGGSIWSSPTYDPATQTVFVSTGNGALGSQKMTKAVIALHASNLTVERSWQVPTNQTGPDSDFGTTPTLVASSLKGPLVVATNKNGLAYAFNRSNVVKGPIWTDRIAIGGTCPECGQGSVSSGAFDGVTLFLAGGKTTIGGVNYSGSVRAINPDTGHFLWQRGLGGFVLPALSYADGLVVAGAGKNLIVLDAATGTVLRNFTTGGVLYGSAVIAHGCIIFGSTDKSVYALGEKGKNCAPPTGTVGHHASILPSPARPFFLPTGYSTTQANPWSPASGLLLDGTARRKPSAVG